jgi:MoxR-like ATPase
MIKMTSLSSSKREKPLVKRAKKGRPRSENPMAHTAVVLPTDLIARLKADAEVKGQGLSAEIRDRLAATYFNQGSSSDRETKNFLEAVRKLADLLARDLGTRWYEHSYALAAFKAGVAALLSRYLLEGDESMRPDSTSTGGPDDPPDVVGRTYARLIPIGEP